MLKRKQPSEEDPSHRKRPAILVTQSSPLVESNQNDTAVRVNGLAFRISNIPSHITGDEFFRIIDSLPREASSNDGQANTLGWSFAPAAASADSERYSTATITFESAPTLFQFKASSCFVSLLAQSHVIADKNFYGLTPLNVSSQQTTVDIVAVTGLAGHGFGSWKARGCSAMWLRDFLPESVPTARIMTYGYDSRLFKNDSTASIREFSQNFLEALSTVRGADARRPIIFIGHSLGGLVIKQALMQAAKSGDQRRLIFHSCYALLLFGVPNGGLEVERLRDMVKGQPNSQLIEDLDSSSDFLRRHNFFWEYQRAPDTRVISVYETQPTSTVEKTSGGWAQTGPKAMMVCRESAIRATPEGNQDDIFSIDANHSEIVKFTNSACPDYLNVRSRIITLVQDAPSVISKRFEAVESQGKGGSVPGDTSHVKSMYTQFQGEDEEREQRKILKWLSRIEYMQHHQIALEGILERTGQWLLKKEEFRTWRSSNVSSILWLHGIPGAGKTKLTCMIIETIRSPLQHSKSQQTCEPVAFFYCNQNDPERRDPTAILKALVKQMSLALPGLPRPVVAEYNKTKEHVSLNFQQSQDLLVSLLDIFPQTTIIIDALDESDPTERGRLLEVFNTIMRSSVGVVKIFISSRDDIDIKLRLDKVPNLYIEAEDNKEDIERFIDREMADSIKNRRLSLLPADLKIKIVSILAAKAKGMFQWVNLQITYLNGMRFDDDIMDSLGKLPGSLEATYSRILAAMREGTTREWAVTKRALMWMVCSQTQLTQQIWAELAYWPNSVPKYGVATLFELCQHLVRSNGKSEVVSFAHLSIREYLETEWTPEDLNSMAAESCLSIVESQDYPRMGICNSKGTLMHYAFRYWPAHLNSSYRSEKHMSRRMLDHVKRFLGSPAVPSQAYCRWSVALSKGHKGSNWGCLERNSGNCYPEDLFDHLGATPANPLFVAAYFRFGEELHEMWACNDLGINSKNVSGRTLLHVGSMTGNDGVANILLTMGADVGGVAVPNSERPLAAAFKSDNHKVVAQLLNKGANIGWYANTLSAAVEQGARISVMTWLMNREPNTKITESIITALASDGHRKKELLMILDRTPNIEITEAVANLATDIEDRYDRFIDIDGVISLLERHPEMKITEAAVTAFARANDLELIRKLLDREPPIKITEAVVAAVAATTYCGIGGALEILLDWDPNIKVTEAVVAAAASNIGSAEELLEILLEWDPNIKVTEAVVVAAASNLSEAPGALEILLAWDPNFKLTEAVVVAAASNPFQAEGAIKVLLARDPNIKVTEAVVVAAASDTYTGERVFRLLLARDSNLEITEEAVITITRICTPDVIARLLVRDPNIVITEGFLLAVFNRGNTRNMKVLLARGTNILITETVMVAAARHGSYKMLKLLILSAANIEITEAVLDAALLNEKCSDRLIAMLRARDPTIKITVPLMTDAAENTGYDKRPMETALARDSHIDTNKAVITEAVVAAAETYDGERAREILLARGPDSCTTKRLLLIAVKSQNSTKVKMLLAEDHKVKITEELLLAAVECPGWEMMEMLLAGKPDIELTLPVMRTVVKYGWSDGLMEILHPSAAITEAFLIAAVEDRVCSRFISMLLTRDPEIGITEAVVAAAIGNRYQAREMMGILLSRDPNIQTTEAAMVAAAGNRGQSKEMMEVLLSRNPDIHINETVMTAATKNSRCGEELIKILLARKWNVEIGEVGLVHDMVVARNFGSEVVTILMPRDTNIKPVMVVGKRNFRGKRTSVELFSGSDVKITETVVAAASNNLDHGKGVIKMLLNRDYTIEVTEAALIEAEANPECDKELLEMLLARDHNIKIAKAVAQVMDTPTHIEISKADLEARQRIILQTD